MSESILDGAVLVDARTNALLWSEQVAFHWWNENRTSRHWHNFYEFFLITAGSAAHWLNGGVCTLETGTLHMIRPSDVHEITADPESGCTHINLLILPEKLATLCDALNVPLPPLCAAGAPKALLADAEMAFFLARADRLSLSVRGSDEASRLILEMLAEALFLLSRSLPGAPDGRPVWFADLTRRLRAPERIACRAADVYAMAPCSAPVLIDCFRRYEGCTVVSYLTRLRMDYAESLLMTTNFSVQQVALRLGYDSVSHFCRIFRAHTGLSPEAYRTAQG